MEPCLNTPEVDLYYVLYSTMSCMLRPLVYCMYMYNVQISHTSLVFVSECNTQSHTAVWLLLLQVALQ